MITWQTCSGMLWFCTYYTYFLNRRVYWLLLISVTSSFYCFPLLLFVSVSIFYRFCSFIEQIHFDCLFRRFNNGFYWALACVLLCRYIMFFLITARGKVMFLHLCVILFTGRVSVREGSLSWEGDSVQGVSPSGAGCLCPGRDGWSVRKTPPVR